MRARWSPLSSCPRRLRSALVPALAWAYLAAVAPGLHANNGTYESLPVERRKEMQREVRVVIGLLENLHYRSKTFVEIAPDEILASYMGRLDPLRLVFLASDEKYLRRRFGTTMKSSYLLSGDLYPAFEIYDVFRERWTARLEWVRRRLGEEFNLERDDTCTLEREPAAGYPSSAAAADADWERLLTAWIISERLDGRGASDAAEAVRRRIDQLDRAVVASEAGAIEETFLNVVLALRDPHSGYHSWDSMLDLEADLAGAFVGVGIEVRRVGQDVVIAQLSPGGAAEASGDVRVGERLVAIGEGDGSLEPTESLHVRDVVRRLRGAPGTRVRLSLWDGTSAPAREVVIERRRVVVEADRARAFVFSMAGTGPGSPARAIGVIRLPSFYGETGSDGRTSTSSADDVAELLEGLKAGGIRGLVLDLRDNPGGRTDEAVRIAGLFLNVGPVMYLAGGDRGAAQAPVVQSDTVAGCAWSGPLVVLTSAGSASAAELVSGALQAYGRALVVGSGRTFGKGTSQSVIPLADAAQRLGIAAGEHFGLLRVTGQMFFLPNGNSTQVRGVSSDLVLGSASHGGESTEGDMPGALPWRALTIEGFAGTRDAAIVGCASIDDALRDRLLSASAQRAQALSEFEWDRRRLAYRERRDTEGPVVLHLGRRAEARASLDAERRVLTDERRRLATEMDWAWQHIELASVMQQRQAHAASRAAATAGGADRLIENGVFRMRADESSTWRELRLDGIDSRLVADDSEVLAEAFSAASGKRLGAPDLRQAALAFRDEEYDQSRVMARRLAVALDVGIDDGAFQRGWVALFSRLVDLNPWLVGDPMPLDVPLRESMRIAGDWSDALASTAP